MLFKVEFICVWGAISVMPWRSFWGCRAWTEWSSDVTTNSFRPYLSHWLQLYIESIEVYAIDNKHAKPLIILSNTTFIVIIDKDSSSQLINIWICISCYVYVILPVLVITYCKIVLTNFRAYTAICPWCGSIKRLNIFCDF